MKSKKPRTCPYCEEEFHGSGFHQHVKTCHMKPSWIPDISLTTLLIIVGLLLLVKPITYIISFVWGIGSALFYIVDSQVWQQPPTTLMTTAASTGTGFIDFFSYGTHFMMCAAQGKTVDPANQKCKWHDFVNLKKNLFFNFYSILTP